MSAAFDPQSLLDDEAGSWSFAEVPIYQALASLADASFTGVLRIWSQEHKSALFFREGQPVGVKLAEVYMPLGQLLLELGILDSAGFVRAQRAIELEGRLPGQVYTDLGVLDQTTLREVLAEQARRKARRFIELCQGPFELARGLAHLTDFVAAPLGIDALILIALERHFDEAQAEAYLDRFGEQQLKSERAGLLDYIALGYSHAEERFAQRLKDWQGVQDLDRFGTLDRRAMSLLLRFLDLRHLLQIRPAPEALPLLQSEDEARVFDVSAAPPPRSLSVDMARAVASSKSPRRREKTERISVNVKGWKTPSVARVEKTEITHKPKVVVDFDALRGAEDAGED